MGSQDTFSGIIQSHRAIRLVLDYPHHLTATVGKQQLTGLMGQRLAGGIHNTPIKTGLSLGLSDFGSMAGVGCTFTIDTGSDVTIVRLDILQASGTGVETIIGQIRTAAGEMTPIQTKGLIELSIGNLKTQHEIWVADVYDNCILGMDFLQKNECLVDLKTKILQARKEEILLIKGRRSTIPSCCRVV